MLLSRVNVGRSKDPSVGRLVFRVSRYGDEYLRRYLLGKVVLTLTFVLSINLYTTLGILNFIRVSHLFIDN